MELKYGVTGNERKELIKAISEILQVEPIYKGVPSFAYEIGGFTVDKIGTVIYDMNMDSNRVDSLIHGLAELGYHFECPDRLVIEVPMEGLTEASIANLEKLIMSKASLIKKAVGVDSLAVERTDATLRFPWFSFSATPEQVKAYSRFVVALCTMAKTQHRVNATAKEVDNEKYAFRCFLLRLGFIGKEYKAERKVLLDPLEGNTAFKNKPAEEEVSAE